MADTEYSERRRYARHPGPFDGWCVDGEPAAVRVMNLNLGGCFVLVNSEREIGQTFHLRIDLGDEGLLEVSATTLYHSMNGSAVTFLNLTQNAFKQIQRAVDASWASEPMP
jgi:hypothetical protein